MTYDCGYGAQNQFAAARDSDHAIRGVYHLASGADFRFIPVKGKESTYRVEYSYQGGDIGYVTLVGDTNWLYNGYSGIENAVELEVFKQDHNNANDPMAHGP